MLDWNAIGAVGETLGALAVVATLVYLARQLQQSREAEKRGALRSHYDRWSEVRRMMLSDAAILAVWARGHDDPASLSDEEQLRFLLAYQELTHQLHAAWALQRELESDRMTDHADYVTSVNAHFLARSGGDYWWRRSASQFAPEYVREVERKAEVLRVGGDIGLALDGLWLPLALDELRDPAPGSEAGSV